MTNEENEAVVEALNLALSSVGGQICASRVFDTTVSSVGGRTVITVAMREVADGDHCSYPSDCSCTIRNEVIKKHAREIDTIMRALGRRTLANTDLGFVFKELEKTS